MRRLVLDGIGGFLAAQFFVLGLLLFDIGGLGGLVRAAEQPLLPVFMLALSLGGLVGAASMATVAAPLPWPRGGRRPVAVPAPVPVSLRRDG